MTSKQQNQINYLINLLGRKRSIIEQEINHSNSDQEIQSELESEEEEIYTNLPRKEMLEQLSSLPNWQMKKSNLTPSQYISKTTQEQEIVTNEIIENYLNFPHCKFKQDQHLSYILKSLFAKLPSYYKSLDANHSWMIYWLANSFYVIKKNGNEIEKENADENDEKNQNELDDETINLINQKIESCIIENGKGGISGGKNQLGHVASTYAGILALILTKNYKILSAIKKNIYNWLLSLKIKINESESSFLMHKNGEYDTRSTYCVLVVATILNIKTTELTNGVENWLLNCQSYEGGFSGIPNTEAHGGYNFCAISSLFLLNSNPEVLKSKIKNFPRFIKWNIDRYTEEGGFNGRSNKLVDSCYSFWIGSSISLTSVLIGFDLANKESLKNYILRISQNNNGGFKDKPNKSIDFYHTNYTLMGLSLCEYNYKIDDKNEINEGNEVNEINDNDDCLALRLIQAESEDENSDVKFTNFINPVFGIPSEFLNQVRLANI
ncbi:RAM1 [Candida pseudojiufengensis]|uniref:RAM1 n=1 Tax=Candida pseudojiufengensis TaxID=497109 RepID=UPI0022257435|nr:RAM1 [Candida pseudojiufengensis]KAI5965589.1 RAM1 [Candida pseudojiufengensis]